MDNYECQASSVLGVHEDFGACEEKLTGSTPLPRFWFLGLRWATYKLLSHFLTSWRRWWTSHRQQICVATTVGVQKSPITPVGLLCYVYTPPHPPVTPAFCHDFFPSWVLTPKMQHGDRLLSFRATPLSSTQAAALSIACSCHCWVCPWWGRATAHQLNPGRTSGLFPSSGDCLNKLQQKFWYRCSWKQWLTFSTKVDIGDLFKGTHLISGNAALLSDLYIPDRQGERKL